MLPTATESHYLTEQRIAVATARSIRGLWNRMTLDFDSSFRQLSPLMLEAFSTGQRKSAEAANAYVPAVLYETGQPDLPVADVNVAAFVGRTADGRPSQSLLFEAVIKAKAAVARGLPPRVGLLQGRNFLDKAVLTELADAGRQTVAANLGTRPTVTGYVRMLNPPSCPDCVLLAGKWYRWNTGFQRHPRCDCRHIPSAENKAGDLSTDPYAYFHSLTEAEQDKMFGRSEARAIRDGADIYRVVNTSKRGLGTVKSRALFGTPTRLTVDDIYRTAGTRTNALRMMTEEGYITGPQIAGGNILGGRYEGFGALGKGGRARAASDAVEQARITGTRDPLNRYTMTAAERRIYDANWRLEYIRRTGNYPNSVGENSADKHSRARKATPQQIALVRAELQKQLAALPNQPRSVSALAQRLGLVP
jgi:hypothetical protein